MAHGTFSMIDGFGTAHRSRAAQQVLDEVNASDGMEALAVKCGKEFASLYNGNLRRICDGGEGIAAHRAMDACHRWHFYKAEMDDGVHEIAVDLLLRTVTVGERIESESDDE